MSRAPIYWIVLVAGCSSHQSPSYSGDGGGSSPTADLASGFPSGSDLAGIDLSRSSGDLAGQPDLAQTPAASGNNVVPMIVDNGPNNIGSVDVPFVSVTICVPGTSQCQTIDHISVDTGSTGLRIISTALTLPLPQANAANGNPLVECFQFADGYTWGSVRNADVKLGGEIAAAIPIQLVGDPAYNNVPGDCSSSGSSEDTVADFGGNGLLGINQALADCGSSCTGNMQGGGYYSCTGANCTAVAVDENHQLPNPIARFAADNNGAILQFPSVAGDGAATLTGSLIFGIGTQANNGLGSASVLTVDGEGNFTTTFNGSTYNTSFLDSGTNSLSFNDSSLPQCRGNNSGYFCPTSTVSLTAQNQGRNGVSSMVQFSVANTDTLFANQSDTAFATLAGTGIDNNSFDWGFPFFIGRTVFVAFDGASTPGGSGPYFAY